MDDSSIPQRNSPVGSTSKDDLSSVMHKVKESVSDVAEPIKEKALETAEQKKDAGADQLLIVARAVRSAAEQLDAEMPQFAAYIRNTGTQLDEASADLRQRKLDELFSLFSNYSKRQPAMVFGGAVLAGLALSRFLKSSSAGHPSAGSQIQGTPSL